MGLNVKKITKDRQERGELLLWRRRELRLKLGEYNKDLGKGWCWRSGDLAAAKGRRSLTLVIAYQPGGVNFPSFNEDDFGFDELNYDTLAKMFNKRNKGKELGKGKALDNSEFIKNLREDEFERLKKFLRFNRGNRVVLDCFISDDLTKKTKKPFRFLFPDVWSRYLSAKTVRSIKEEISSKFPGGRFWLEPFAAIFGSIWECVTGIDDRQAQNKEEFLGSLKDLAFCAASLKVTSKGQTPKEFIDELNAFKAAALLNPRTALELFLLDVYRSIVNSSPKFWGVNICSRCNRVFLKRDTDAYKSYCSRDCRERQRVAIYYLRKGKRRRALRRGGVIKKDDCRGRG